MRYSPRMMRRAAALAFVVTALVLGAPCRAAESAQDTFIAAMQKAHHGKMSPAMLARMGEAVATMHQDGGVVAMPLPIRFTGTDTAEIARYLNQPPAPALRTAQAAAVTAPAPQAPAPQPPADERTYVGQKICEGCHRQEATNWAHTIHAKVFAFNPRDTQETRGCEACHGPGSAHIKAPREPLSIIRFSSTSQTPLAVQNGQCLSCHQGGQRIFWHGSAHDTARVACADCHNPMGDLSARGETARQSINDTCMQCHKTQQAQFHMRSHMPLPEGKLSCTDCHNPHGSTTAPLLKADSINELCYGCHAEKRGPFLFEHAPVRESCLNCHNAHGSNFEALLNTPRPVLCQQCHSQLNHPAVLMTRGNLAGGSAPDPRLIAGACQTCHVNIHGSNSPSGGRFQR